MQDFLSGGALWIYITIAAVLLRSIALIGMAATVNGGGNFGVAEIETSGSSDESYLSVSLLWRLSAVIAFSFCSGLSTSLSYIVALGAVRSLAASGDERIVAVHLTVYSLLESSDDWTRTCAGGLAGFALTALQANYARFFLLAAGLGVIPLVSGIGLAYVTRRRDTLKPLQAHAD